MAHKKKKAPPSPPPNKTKQVVWLTLWGGACLYFSAWTFIFLARGVPLLALLHFAGALFSFLIALLVLKPDNS
jgi:hypothetical protein